MEESQAFHSENNAGSEDEFSSTLKKIIDKQSDLEKEKAALKKENDILTNDLCSIKQQKDELLKKREILKLSVVREQDNFDHTNARLMNEMFTIKTLFGNVDTASKLSDDFIKKNSIVSSFFDGISCNYNNLQESINNMALKITQENMDIKDKVTTFKQYKEQFQSDLQNDIIQCESDLANISNAVSCMKKVIFEKHLEFSKLSVTTEYVCDEESKDISNLQNLETKLMELSNDGRNCIDEKQSFIFNLEKREQTLRNTLLEIETNEKIVKQSIDVAKQNLSDLEKYYRERELEEKSSNEELTLMNGTVNELVMRKCTLQSELKAKEDLNQDNEKMIFALLDVENKYKLLISEKDEIESDIDFVENDMKVYLQDIESEKRNQSKEIATKKKIQTDIDSLNAHSNESNEKHFQNMSLMKEEIENYKKSLNEYENVLLEIETSNTNKTQKVHEYKSLLHDCRNALATCMEILEIQTNKVEEYEKSIGETEKKYKKSLEEINATLNLKKEELNAAERNSERISSLKQEIEQLKSEISKQKEQIQSELLQFENDNLCCKNDVEERFETLKIQLENKNKKIQTELLEYQTGLTELENMEHKLKISTTAIKDELANVKTKTIQLFNTKKLLQSKFSKARRNLRSADEKSDDISGSQLSILQRKDDDEDSSSGISTSDPRWAIPKRKSGKSSLEERSQKK